MDHEKLLDTILRSFDEKTSLMRADISRLDEKLDGYQERLIVVENNLGFVKSSLLGFLSIIGTALAYVFYKFIDSITGLSGK